MPVAVFQNTVMTLVVVLLKFGLFTVIDPAIVVPHDEKERDATERHEPMNQLGDVLTKTYWKEFAMIQERGGVGVIL
jgi:hypothetical protein